jgi:hypothetical protein
MIIKIFAAVCIMVFIGLFCTGAIIGALEKDRYERKIK